MVVFLYGVSAMGCAIIGLFFLRFWRQSRDRLFLLFALAFWILAVDRVVLGSMFVADEMRPYVYIIRLCAFSLILYGIADKNRRA